jgi:hypothetical protein
MIYQNQPIFTAKCLINPATIKNVGGDCFKNPNFFIFFFHLRKIYIKNKNNNKRKTSSIDTSYNACLKGKVKLELKMY